MPVGGPIKRVPSMKRGSISAKGEKPAQQELPWDMIDRCLLPIIFCHAAAVLLSTILNVLRISQVSTFTLFIWFTVSTMGAILFYHNLKVSAAGKAVLVTGCDSAIGWTLAQRLDELGFTVFAGFRSRSGNADADLLKEVCSGRLHTLQLDTTSETQILSASLYIVEHLPDGASGLHAVVNAAAWCAMGELEWVPFSVVRRSMDVNLLGTTRLTQAMLPLVRKARGRIVFVTSGLARVSAPVRGVHCAGMAALEALAACLRRELRPRAVDVVVVAPGEYTSGNAWLSETSLLNQAKDMWEQLSQEQRQLYGEDYFEQALRSLEKFVKGPDADLTPVTRSLVDSVQRTFPLPRYTPVTRAEKVQALVATHLPSSVYDIIYNK
uniref:Putative corticosteroid 11-beta-dehydrogenase n=1 Tax=Xenopsylla cheopis TaxID=163159 RepID=A0A6M2DTY0_XENCH